MSYHENDFFLQMNSDDSDIDELYDQERLSEEEGLEIIDTETDDADQNNASQTIDVDNAVEIDQNTGFTLSLLINGNLFVLEADPARGKCTLCKKTYRTANQASDLTKHLVNLNILRGL